MNLSNMIYQHELAQSLSEFVIDTIIKESITYYPGEANEVRPYCYATIYVWGKEDFIMIKKSDMQLLEEYANFEKVENSHKKTLGEYMFYTAKDEENLVKNLIRDLYKNRRERK